MNSISTHLLDERPLTTPALLIVDDEDNILRTLTRSLRQTFSIYTAASGQAALEILAHHSIDIILTDQRMPGMTGVELLAQAELMSPATVGLIITAYTDVEALVAALNLSNVAGYIAKPWNIESLQQRLMKAVVKQHERFVQQVLDATPSGLLVYDVMLQRNIYVNQGASTILGYTVEVIQHMPGGVLLHLAHPDDLLQVKEHQKRVMAAPNNEPASLRVRLKHADGTWRWIQHTDRVYSRDSAGQPTHILRTFQDVSESVHAAEALKELNAHLDQRVQDSTAELQRYADKLATINRIDRAITASLDINQVYETFITEMVRIFNLDRCSVVLLDDAGENMQIARQWTRGVSSFAAAAWYPVAATILELVVKSKQPILEREIGEKGDWSTNKLLIQEGIHSRLIVPLIIHDRVIGVFTQASYRPAAFTEQDAEQLNLLADQLVIAIENARLYKQMEHHAAELEQRVSERTLQLEQRAADLQSANKELEAFSYSVSHDLRAPLRALDGFSRILLEDYTAVLPAEAQHYLERLRDNAQQMGHLIDDLLAFSRLSRQPLMVHPVAIEQLVRQVVTEQCAEVLIGSRRVQVTYGDLPACEADEPLLRQVLVNLISNAVKFTRKSDPSVIEIGSSRQDGACVYFIKDNGVGFDMRYADKLFGVFQRLHRVDEFEGTGVGLAIVQRIIMRHGGRVWASSEKNKGAAFFFTLGENKNDDIKHGRDSAG